MHCVLSCHEAVQATSELGMMPSGSDLLVLKAASSVMASLVAARVALMVATGRLSVVALVRSRICHQEHMHKCTLVHCCSTSAHLCTAVERMHS